MKLSKLLYEINSDVAIEQLEKKLSSGKYFISSTPFYRGVRNISKTFDVRVPRTSRSPKHTGAFADQLVEEYRKLKYPQYPSRKRAIFATGTEQGATTYGTVHYIFPSKKSLNIYKCAYDTYTIIGFTSNLLSDTRGAIVEVFDRVDLNKLYEMFPNHIRALSFTHLFSECHVRYDEIGIGKIAKLIAKIGIDKLVEELDNFVMRLRMQIDYDPIDLDQLQLTSLEDAVGSISDYLAGSLRSYFEDFVKPYTKRDSARRYAEIIIECEEYLIVNAEWLLEHYFYDELVKRFSR